MNQGLLSLIERIIAHFEGDVRMGANENGRCLYRVSFENGEVGHCAIGCLLSDPLVDKLAAIPACSQGQMVDLWSSTGSILAWWNKSFHDEQTKDWLSKWARELGIQFEDMIALSYIQRLHDNMTKSKDAFVAVMKGIKDETVVYHPGMDGCSIGLEEIKVLAEQVMMRLHHHYY